MAEEVLEKQNTYLLYRGLLQTARMHYFRRIVKKSGLKAGMRLLDYGCGPGDMLLTAQEFDIEAHGIDNFERSVSMAKKRGLDVVHGDSSSMPYPKEHFDVIFSQSVLEHVHDPVELVKQLTPYLKPNGTLVLSCPTPGAHFWDDPTHVRPFTPKSFLTLADICGCRAAEVNYVFSFLLGLKLKNSLFYKLMNLLPFPLGSNIVGFFKLTP